MNEKVTRLLEMCFDSLDQAGKEFVYDYVAGALPERMGIKPQVMRKTAEYAKTLVQVGRVDEALELYRGALLLDPLNSEYTAGFANCALMMGRADDALRTAALLVASDPDNPAGYAISGAACRMKGLYKEAAEDFADAMRLAEASGKWELFHLVQQMNATLPN
jgi:tetratricopeptide (TPR) repeat protein